MNGMLRDLSASAQTLPAPRPGPPRPHRPGRATLSRRRRAAVCGAVAAVAITVGASFALAHVGDDPTGPPVSPPTTNSPSNSTSHPTPPIFAAIHLRRGPTIHYGDRVIEAAEDPDGLYVFDDGLWFLTGENEGPSTTHLYYTDGSSEPVEIARGIDRVTPGEVGSLLVWLDGDDLVIYDTDVRGVVARVPLNGQRLGNPIIPLEDAVYCRSTTICRVHQRWPIGSLRHVGRNPDSSVAGGRTRRRGSGGGLTPPRRGLGQLDGPGHGIHRRRLANGVEASSERADGPAFVAATGERLGQRPRRVRRRVAVPVPVAGRRPVRARCFGPRLGRVPTGDLLVCRISAGRCRTVASGEQDWLLPGPFGGVGAEG